MAGIWLGLCGMGESCGRRTRVRRWGLGVEIRCMFLRSRGGSGIQVGGFGFAKWKGAGSVVRSLKSREHFVELLEYRVS